jgi:hypothetical protein
MYGLWEMVLLDGLEGGGGMALECTDTKFRKKCNFYPTLSIRQMSAPQALQR